MECMSAEADRVSVPDELVHLRQRVRELEHAAQAQAHDLRLYKTMVEHAPDWMGIVDADGLITHANQACRVMTGYTDGDEILGLPIISLFDTSQADIGAVVAAVMEHGIWNGVLPARRKDGSLYSIQASIFTARDADGVPFGTVGIMRDLTPQLEAAAERAQLQEQVITAQQALLRELSMPLIPLAQGVLVMPLIGTLDSARAQQVLDTLLDGVAKQHAQTVILDITGVSVVDSQVAQALMRAAQAAKLLGAQVILTGIRSEVAQTIVGLGIELDSIITLSTLQAGVQFALRSAAPGGAGAR